MDIRVACPYCDNEEYLDMERYDLNLLDFKHDLKVENLSHICSMCVETYTFDIELDISTMSFAEQYHT